MSWNSLSQGEVDGGCGCLHGMLQASGRVSFQDHETHPCLAFSYPASLRGSGTRSHRGILSAFCIDDDLTISKWETAWWQTLSGIYWPFRIVLHFISYTKIYMYLKRSQLNYSINLALRWTDGHKWGFYKLHSFHVKIPKNVEMTGWQACLLIYHLYWTVSSVGAAPYFHMKYFMYFSLYKIDII